MNTSGIGYALIAGGSVFVYAGIKGYSVLAAVQNLITGVPVGVGNTTAPLSSGSGTDVVAQGIQPASGSPRELGKAEAVLYGWTGTEWDALDKLWTRESGWNPHAENKSSHAYGIPQALPYTKMPPAAWPERVGGKSDAAQQIQWGLAYIKGRYGRPSVAWAHEQANSWY